MVVSEARSAAMGAAWLYGSQVGILVIQVFYAAVTARLLSDDQFGAYGVALSVAALFTLLANGGTAQSVARMDVLDRRRLAGFTIYASVCGSVFATIVLVTASIWSAAWGVQSATGSIRVLAISAFLAPILGIFLGIARQKGEFRLLALTGLATNLFSMAVGLVVVVSSRATEALLVSPVGAQIGLATVLALRFRREVFVRPSFASIRDDLRFSGAVNISSFVSYFSGNVGRWATTVSAGPGALGQWNRAEVLTVVPLQQFQTALISSVYPLVGKRGADPGAVRSSITDILVLAAWITIPALSVFAAVVPWLALAVFGGDWSIAASITPILAIIGGVQIIVILLASCVEAVGRFNWVWASLASAVLVQGGAAAWVLVSGQWTVSVWATGFALCCQHTVQILLARRSGFLDAGRLLKEYSIVSSLSAGGYLLLVALSNVDTVWVRLSLYCLLALAFVTGLWIQRLALPPLVIADRYNLLPKRLSLLLMRK